MITQKSFQNIGDSPVVDDPYNYIRERLEQKTPAEELFETTIDFARRFEEVIYHDELANFFMLVQTTKEIETKTHSDSVRTDYQGQKTLFKDLKLFQEVYKALLCLCISVHKGQSLFEDEEAILESLLQLPVYPKIHFRFPAYIHTLISEQSFKSLCELVRRSNFRILIQDDNCIQYQQFTDPLLSYLRVCIYNRLFSQVFKGDKPFALVQEEYLQLKSDLKNFSNYHSRVLEFAEILNTVHNKKPTADQLQIITETLHEEYWSELSYSKRDFLEEKIQSFRAKLSALETSNAHQEDPCSSDSINKEITDTFSFMKAIYGDVIAVKPQVTRENLRSKINGDQLLEKLDNVRLLELTRCDEFRGTKEENWYSHIYRELANYSSGKELAIECLAETLRLFQMLDQFQDLDIRFSKFNPESIIANFQENQKAEILKIFSGLKIQLASLSAIMERFKVFGSEEVISLFDQYSSYKDIFNLLEGKLKIEIAKKIVEAIEKSQAGESFHAFFQMKNLLGYMQSKLQKVIVLAKRDPNTSIESFNLSKSKIPELTVVEDLDDDSDIDQISQPQTVLTPQVDEMIEAILEKTQPSILGLLYLEYIIYKIKVENSVSWREIKRIYKDPSFEMNQQFLNIRTMLSYLKIVDQLVIYDDECIQLDKFVSAKVAGDFCLYYCEPTDNQKKLQEFLDLASRLKPENLNMLQSEHSHLQVLQNYIFLPPPS